MKFVPITIIAILFAVGYSETAPQFISSVPPEIAQVLAATQTTCVNYTDCTNQFPNLNATNLDCFDEDSPINGTDDLFLCQYFGCGSNDDCADGEECFTLKYCTDEDEFHDSAFSSFCWPNTLCSDIRTEAEWSSTTECFTGADGEIYTSEADAILCGNGIDGTCVASVDTCLDSEDDDDDDDDDDSDAKECLNDASCCNQDNWDQEACVELLLGDWLMYSIGAIAIIVLCCCCLCGCCIYKKRKRSMYDDEMDRQTDPFNVYI